MNKEWTEWYVRYTKKGTKRVLKKPTGNEVFGGAGSVSNMAPVYLERDFETGKDEETGIAVIRFSMRWASKSGNESFLGRHYTLKEYLEAQRFKEEAEIKAKNHSLGEYF